MRTGHLIVLLAALLPGPAPDDLLLLLSNGADASSLICTSASAEEGVISSPSVSPASGSDRSTPPGTAQPEGSAIVPASLPTGTTAPPSDQGMFDSLHREITHQLLTTAEWMDSFFADENYVKEVNRTYARVRYEMFEEERSSTWYKPAVDLRLALPQLERKTHLVFSAEPAEPTTGAAPVRTLGERFGTTDQRSVTTALYYFFRTTPKESFLVRTGLQLKQLTPVIFLAPRYRILFPYSSWDLRFAQEVLWRSDNGWQTDTRFDLERPLAYDLFFRSTLDGVWAARTKGYLYSLSFTVRQPLDPVRAFDYEWINSYQTRPVHALTEVALRIRYRQSFLRDWLFFELAPQVRYPRDRNFNGTPGILFKFEMFFGRTT